MHVPRSERIPKYRLHKASGRAFVQLNGKRRYLGAFDDPQSRVRYNRLIGYWQANDRTLPLEPGSQLTIAQLCDRFDAWAEKRYANSNEADNFKRILKPLRELYGETPAVNFGPLDLITVREQYVGKGWTRRGVNRAVERVRRPFRWASARKLLPAAVHAGLKDIESLSCGESQLREPKRIKPMPIEHVNAIQSHVSRQVWAIIQLQLLTGARGGEIATMRAVDLDMSKPTWVYKPIRHKTAHRDKERVIYLGPQAQEMIKPFLAGRSIDAFLFSPKEARAEWLDARHKARIAEGTPLNHGNGVGKNRKRDPKRAPGAMYRTAVYGRAIARACETAKVPHWHPHQLRHYVATELRRKFGVEVARVMLGHNSLRITEIYAEEDHNRAVEVVSKIG